jgi:hypothetical protein
LEKEQDKSKGVLTGGHVPSLKGVLSEGFCQHSLFIIRHRFDLVKVLGYNEVGMFQEREFIAVWEGCSTPSRPGSQGGVMSASAADPCRLLCFFDSILQNPSPMSRFSFSIRISR